MRSPPVVPVHPGALAALARRLDEVAFRLQRSPTFPDERRYLVEALQLDAALVRELAVHGRIGEGVSERAPSR